MIRVGFFKNCLYLLFLIFIPAQSVILAHDIPNDRVDRLMIVSLSPGIVDIRYEVSLDELTLIQDFRRLSETEIPSDRSTLVLAYARSVGPLDALGILGTIDSSPIQWRVGPIEVVADSHPVLVFHYRSDLPLAGELVIRDTNYLESDGACLITANADRQVELERISERLGDGRIPESAWLQSVEERDSSRKMRVRFHPSALGATSTSLPQSRFDPGSIPARNRRGDFGIAMSQILDGQLSVDWCLFALVLGLAHALQPGHGKSVIAGVVLRDRLTLGESTSLVTATCVGHLSTIGAVSVLIWFAKFADAREMDQQLTLGSACILSVIGCFRVGRVLGGRRSHDRPTSALNHPTAFAIGMIPCWEVVALLVYAASMDRLGSGIFLSLAYLMGTWLTLVTTCFAASTVRRWPLLNRLRSFAKLAEIMLGFGMIFVGLSILLRSSMVKMGI